jgi:hypothetical protein
MGLRGTVRCPNFCVRPWPGIVLLAAVVTLLTPVGAQGGFGRGFMRLEARLGAYMHPSNKPEPTQLQPISLSGLS